MIDLMLSKLEKVSPKGTGKWIACCPAHEDKTPSLAISLISDGRILINCFAGCGSLEILESIGMTMGDLFPEGRLGEFKGFQRLQESIQATKTKKQEDALAYEKTLLSVCQADRERGQRLSRQTMENERQAFLKIRASQ